MKNELNTDDLDSSNDDGIDSIKELWDELMDNNKTDEESGFIPENEEEAEKMLEEMKECGCIDSTKEMKEKAKQERQD
ncbi:hypothetical protein [Acetohalobium arabaticum]|uniref:Uncharacterized protein n=1 Tax=Acetohalobium arabaticum (strain ATCC 49924 / DSM 5501 / Z-7288) TaxID=574087 RepID=D9QVU0_ACEAZ|nr:hypothetical protein [Acetohalobium arabaticum]ADL12349.1 hypothetical protein Acear_0811 [Acetohalobium arabaticum DSM 5501]